MLKAENLTVNYGEKRILDSISFSIQSGEILAVLGSNGAGKTTLFKSIMRFIKPASGEIYINGKNVLAYTRKTLSREVAYVPQCHNCTFPYTVLEMTVMGCQSRLGSFSEPTHKDYLFAQSVLDKLGVGTLGPRRYRNLSGGEKQLVLIARSLVQRPSIMIMDEPTSNLDLNNSLRVMSEILRLKEQNISLLVTCHSPRQARIFADKVLMIKNGLEYQYGAASLLDDRDVVNELYNIDMDNFSDWRIKELIANAV